MPRLPAVSFLLLLCLPLTSQGQPLEPDQIEILEQLVLSSDSAVAFDAACRLFQQRRYTPPDYAFHVLIEQFRTDDVPGNATTATRFLERWSSLGRAYPESAQQRLWANLNSSDAQMQYLSAHALAANSHIIADTPLKLRLIDQFRADDFHRTAVRAMRSVLRGPIEPVVVQHLEAALTSDDDQQRFFAACTLDQVDDYVPARQFYQVLVDQFRADDDNMFGREAAWMLNARRPLPPVAIGSLQEALRSDDWVQRLYAGYVLVPMANDGECPLTHDLVASQREVLFTRPDVQHREEGRRLGHDSRYLHYAPERAFDLFAHHRGLETAWIESHLEDSDDQNRFTAARILAIRGDIGQIDRIMEILLANAMTDDRFCNAGEACYALWQMGEASIPEMNLFVGADLDPQMEFVLQRALRLIRENVESASLGQMRGGRYRVSLPHWWIYSTP